ncbi:MAG TPA: F0F1 ATP synthase subunit epsilon [Bryobacteraceae bacterium]|nr:F0F1 ATP synthase subunit epsilon [Bryobacteraceae bacterium]
MAERFELEVATPERELVREEVTEVQIPAKDGYLGILPGHAPLLSQLGIGFLTYPAAGQLRYLSVHGGFVEVRQDHVRVLADMAERAEEIDVERARRAAERATEEMINPNLGVDPAVALAALKRAETRIGVAEKKAG